jgi:hypothetical protein
LASTRPRRLLAVFDDRQAILAAARQATRGGLETLTAFAPAYDEELVDLTARGATRVGTWAVTGAVAGGLAGAVLTIWTTVQWPTLIVGGKPLISIQPYLLIVLELAMLGASLAAFGSFLREAASGRSREADGYDSAFTDAAFGLLIQCDGRLVDQAIAVIRDAGAVKWRFV